MAHGSEPHATVANFANEARVGAFRAVAWASEPVRGELRNGARVGAPCYARELRNGARVGAPCYGRELSK